MNDLPVIENDRKKDNHPIDGIIPEELLNAIPEEDRGKIISIMQKTMFSSIVRSSNPLSEKITSDHITSIISNADIQDKRDRDERKGQRNYYLIILIIALVFLGFIIVFLKEEKELLYKIIIAIISFIGGFGIGKSGIMK